VLAGVITGVVLLLSGGSPQTASQVAQSDGYTVHNGILGSNPDPADISSYALGTQGSFSPPTGSAEMVVVVTPAGQAKESQVVSRFNSQLGGQGLTISTSGDVIRISGPDSAWIAAGQSSSGF
jgi:hypothetical protein